MDLSKKISCILLSDTPQEMFESLKETLHHEVHQSYYNEIFQIEDAHEVVRLAYLQHSEPIWMLIGAKSYNEYAQNRLLKILEEPPTHIFFIMIAPNKSALLPTIRSRLPVFDERSKKIPDPFPISIDKICLRDIYMFTKELSKKFLSKEEVKESIASLLMEVKKSGVSLTQEDLDRFNQAIMLADQFERAEHIFTPLLLRILKRSQQQGQRRFI